MLTEAISQLETILGLLFFLAGVWVWRAEAGLTPSLSEYFELYMNNKYCHM